MPKLSLLRAKKTPIKTIGAVSKGNLTALKFGVPHWTRTSDNLLRRQMLYPSELVALKKEPASGGPKTGFKKVRDTYLESLILTKFSLK